MVEEKTAKGVLSNISVHTRTLLFGLALSHTSLMCQGWSCARIVKVKGPNKEDSFRNGCPNEEDSFRNG